MVTRSPVLGLFFRLAYYGTRADERLYQQPEPLPRATSCLLLLLLLLPPQTRPLTGYRGAVRATFFLPHKASTQFFRGGIPGRAAGLTWGLPRAPPAPWPRGERRRTGPACKDPALSSFLPRGCRPARSFLGWWRSLPAATAGVTDDSADKKQKRTPNDQPQDFFTCSFGTFPQGGTQGQTRASVSALAV